MFNKTGKNFFTPINSLTFLKKIFILYCQTIIIPRVTYLLIINFHAYREFIFMVVQISRINCEFTFIVCFRKSFFIRRRFYKHLCFYEIFVFIMKYVCIVKTIRNLYSTNWYCYNLSVIVVYRMTFVLLDNLIGTMELFCSSYINFVIRIIKVFQIIPLETQSIFKRKLLVNKHSTLNGISIIIIIKRE